MQTIIQKSPITKIITSIRLSPAATYALSLAVLLLCLFFQQFRSSMFLFRTPSVDSSVFLYIGQQILNGKVPYLDVWDHKTPLIYFIDAFGLLLGGGEAWGVWLVEFALHCLSVVICFSINRKLFGTLPAFFGTLLFITSMRLIALPNLTEAYAIPFSFLMLWGYWKFFQRGTRRYLLAIGAAGASSFLLRPNMIGVFTAISLCLFFIPRRGIRQVISRVGFLLAGFLVPITEIVLYFVANQALPQFIDAAFRYNAYYSAYSPVDILTTMFAGYTAFWERGIMLPAALGFLLFLLVRPKETGVAHFFTAVMIALPLEMLLSSISGYPLLHYFATWLPVLAFLCAYFARVVIEAGSNRLINGSRFLMNVGAGAAIIGVCILVIGTTFFLDNSMRWFWRFRDPGTERNIEVASTITKLTQPNDTVLVWGNNAAYNFMTRRSAPTRFVYAGPLLTKGYQSDALVQEFLADITAAKPELIIDATSLEKAFPPVDPGLRAIWLETHDTMLPSMEPFFDYVETHYVLTGRVGEDQFPVYQRK